MGKSIQKVTYKEGKEPGANVICSGNPQVTGVMTVDYKNDSVLYRLKVYGDNPNIWSLNSRSYSLLTTFYCGWWSKRVENVLCSVIAWVTFKSHITVKGWVLLIDEKL